VASTIRDRDDMLDVPPSDECEGSTTVRALDRRVDLSSKIDWFRCRLPFTGPPSMSVLPVFVRVRPLVFEYR
jgi:hypothetical protein